MSISEHSETNRPLFKFYSFVMFAYLWEIMLVQWICNQKYMPSFFVFALFKILKAIRQVMKQFIQEKTHSIQMLVIDFYKITKLKSTLPLCFEMTKILLNFLIHWTFRWNRTAANYIVPKCEPCIKKCFLSFSIYLWAILIGGKWWFNKP